MYYLECNNSYIRLCIVWNIITYAKANVYKKIDLKDQKFAHCKFDRGVESSRCGKVRAWEKSVKKVSVFGLRYVRVDVWIKFIEIREWCDGCKSILNYFE